MNEAVYDVVGVGGAAVDFVYSVADLTRLNDKFECDYVGQYGGGLIANATVAAARLGRRCAIVGWVGDDARGRFLREEFDAAGVDTAGLSTIDAMTPYSLVFVDESGERLIALPRTDIYDNELSPKQLELLTRTRAVVTSPRNESWYRRIRDATPGTLVLDIESHNGIEPASLREIIADTDISFLSRETLRRLDVHALSELQTLGWVIQTDGARGASGMDKLAQEVIHQAAFPANAVDTTGAGDCFHAAVVHARLAGDDLPRALRFASAAAAIKVQTRGARNGLPSLAEVDALLAEATS